VSLLATALRRAVCPSLVLALAACGGGNGGSGAIPLGSGVSSGLSPTSDGTTATTPITPAGDGTAAVTSTSPAPSATPFSVTGQISRLSANGFLIQARQGCGYLNVVTSSSTTTNLNGQKLAAGAFARAWGTGSCATSLTAVAVTLAVSANGPFPAPSGTPITSTPTTTTGTGSTSPATTATTAPASLGAAGNAAGFAGIVNGQSWPASFRPYSASSPWNIGTNGRSQDSANSSHLQAYLSATYTSSLSAPAGPNDFGHPVYFARATDPLVTATCSQYGCYNNNARVGSISLRIPAQARPAQASDHHMGIVQPDGTEVDCWGASYSGGSSLSAGICSTTSVTTGSGVETPSATSGAALAAGVVRFDELSRGSIPHALFVVVSCTSGVVYPGTSNARACGDGAGVPVGAWLHLTLSDAQIDALPSSTIPAAYLPILHALHNYGAFVEDTGGSFSNESGAPGVWFMFEDQQQYASFGQPYPGASFAAAHGALSIAWSALRPYMEVLQHP
jgi:hypothetical protein